MSDKDTIYRQDAIDAMNQIYCHVEMIRKRPVTKGEQALFLDMRATIKELPSAEPRKKGYWIKKEPTIKELHGCYYECSKCHKFSLPFQKLNFCPNCGCQMNGSQEE